jgi:hypothetical protein
VPPGDVDADDRRRVEDADLGAGAAAPGARAREQRPGALGDTAAGDGDGPRLVGDAARGRGVGEPELGPMRRDHELRRGAHVAQHLGEPHRRAVRAEELAATADDVDVQRRSRAAYAVTERRTLAGAAYDERPVRWTFANTHR